MNEMEGEEKELEMEKMGKKDVKRRKRETEG